MAEKTLHAALHSIAGCLSVCCVGSQNTTAYPSVSKNLSAQKALESLTDATISLLNTPVVQRLGADLTSGRTESGPFQEILVQDDTFIYAILRSTSRPDMFAAFIANYDVSAGLFLFKAHRMVDVVVEAVDQVADSTAHLRLAV